MPPSQTATRFDQETLDRLDRVAAAMSESWRRTSRSDVIRKLVLENLSPLEIELGLASAGPVPAKPAKGKR